MQFPQLTSSKGWKKLAFKKSLRQTVLKVGVLYNFPCWCPLRCVCDANNLADIYNGVEEIEFHQNMETNFNKIRFV